MGYGPTVRGGIALAKSLLGGNDNLMDDVTIQFWINDTDEAGTPNLSQPVSFQAVVIRELKLIQKSDGQEVLAQTYLAFLEEIPPRGTGEGRREPLDERDVIVLSDGTTGPILRTTGIMDQNASAPFLLEVYLG